MRNKQIWGFKVIKIVKHLKFKKSELFEKVRKSS